MIKVDAQSKNLFVRLSSATDEKLVANLLGKDYKVWSEDRNLSRKIIDLVIVDYAELLRLYDKLLIAKKKAGIAYLPVMVLVSKERMRSKEMWDIADDVVVMPVGKKNLQTRIKGLIKIRDYSREVKANQKKLERTNRQLQLYYKAIEASTTGVIISDASGEDTPIIFCNKAFTELTGYSESEILGHNCRFLQGDDRDQPARAVIRRAIENKESCDVLIRNYRKDGSMFWNELKISPIKTENGDTEYFVGIQNDISELVVAQKELKSAKDQWEGIVSQSPNLIQISVNKEIRFINKVGANLLGFSHPEEAIGTSVYDLFPESEHGKLNERLKKLKNGKLAPPIIYTMTDNNGDNRYLKMQSIPIMYEGEAAVQTVGVDVTQMKESEMELTSLLNQKQVLLQEVHHRVKNNFAIISGLIELQTANLKNDKVVSYLHDTQMRIISIAKVHEMLYSQENLHEVEFDRYIEQLLDEIENSVILKEKMINAGLNMDSVTLSLDQAIPCGLLLNELITNSIQHGFDEGETIKIDITVVEEENIVTIRYRDYGKGMPEPMDLESSGNFGSMIIRILIEQLNAKYNIETRGGMQIELSFQRAEYRGPSKRFY